MSISWFFIARRFYGVPHQVAESVNGLVHLMCTFQLSLSIDVRIVVTLGGAGIVVSLIQALVGPVFKAFCDIVLSALRIKMRRQMKRVLRRMHL